MEDLIITLLMLISLFGIFFILTPYICINLIIPIIIKEIMFIPLVVMIGILAPADTQKRPLINKKKRTIYKVLSIAKAFISST